MTNNQPNINPTPAQRFRESNESVTKHRDMINGVTYRRAVDFGVQQYAILLADQVRDGNSAAAVGFKLAGAIEVLGTIRHLSEQPVPGKVVPIRQLDHSA